MSRTGSTTKSTGVLPKLSIILPVPPATIGIAAGLLCLGLLAIGSYLAPAMTAFGLAALGLGVPLLLLLWSRPEIGILALIFLASNFVPLDIVDVRLPIGGGLELRDLVLLGMLGLLVFQGLVRKTLYIPWWPVGAPILVFLALALFSAMYALFFQGVEAHWAFAELRDLSSYTLFFVTGWALARRRQMIILLAGLFAIADLAAGIVILQQFLGSGSLLLEAMTGPFWGVWTQSDAATGIGTVRIVPPNHVLIYFMMIMAGCLAVFTRQNKRLRAIFALQFGYLSLGLLLTYTRAQWIATALALVLISAALFPAYKARITRYVLPGIAVLLLVCGFLGIVLQGDLEKISFLDALIERATTIFTPTETLESSSLEWRLFETEQALKSILKHPLMGVGLGNSYREITTLQGEASGWYSRGSLAAEELSRFTRYVHSSYLAIAVKMGLPALICLLWFCGGFMAQAWQLYRNLPESQLKGIVLAVVAGFAGLLVWSIFHQHFMMARSSTTVGLMFGLIAGIYNIQRRQQESFPTYSRSSSRIGDGE